MDFGQEIVGLRSEHKGLCNQFLFCRLSAQSKVPIHEVTKLERPSRHLKVAALAHPEGQPQSVAQTTGGEQRSEGWATHGYG